jgi:hypothetical protein
MPSTSTSFFSPGCRDSEDISLSLYTDIALRGVAAESGLGYSIWFVGLGPGCVIVRTTVGLKKRALARFMDSGGVGEEGKWLVRQRPEVMLCY